MSNPTNRISPPINTTVFGAGTLKSNPTDIPRKPGNTQEESAAARSLGGHGDGADARSLSINGDNPNAPLLGSSQENKSSRYGAIGRAPGHGVLAAVTAAGAPHQSSPSSPPRVVVKDVTDGTPKALERVEANYQQLENKEEEISSPRYSHSDARLGAAHDLNIAMNQKMYSQEYVDELKSQLNKNAETIKKFAGDSQFLIFVKTVFKTTQCALHYDIFMAFVEGKPGEEIEKLFPLYALNATINFLFKLHDLYTHFCAYKDPWARGLCIAEGFFSAFAVGCVNIAVFRNPKDFLPNLTTPEIFGASLLTNSTLTPMLNVSHMMRAAYVEESQKLQSFCRKIASALQKNALAVFGTGAFVAQELTALFAIGGPGDDLEPTGGIINQKTSSTKFQKDNAVATSDLALVVGGFGLITGFLKIRAVRKQAS